MVNNAPLWCDGCGQKASPEHIARRLRRLEWATRYRPVHIQTLLLGAVAPSTDSEFLYSPGGEFHGEAGLLLRAVGISFEGRPAETVHAEFQSAGLFLTHLLECPLNGQRIGPGAMVLIREHLPLVASRIRRSLKPKRVMLVTEAPEPVLEDVLALDLDCPIILDEGKPLTLRSLAEEAGFSRFRELLSAAGRN